MKQCPVCRKEMKNHLLYCPFDGQLLTTKTEPDEFLGRIIEEKYRIEEKVGEGGMGKVYRATHIHIGRTVAIKILLSQLATDQIAIERFRREARAAGHIQHPNAVDVTDFGVMKDTGMAYLVMEFLTGIELRQRIKEKKQLDYEETFLIVHQTCSALQAAHVKGIIHRDLKPDNIWLLSSEDDIPRIKVLDFGIAKLKTDTESNQLTQQGMILGTPYYMSPEQCRSEELDARSDIYSLGVILYEMLTGQVPFNALNPMGVALKHTTEAPRPLRELRDNIPEPLEAVVLRALKKERKDRQESAALLAQEFEAALYEAGIELKVLGTNTPQSILPGAISYPTFRNPNAPPDRIRANESDEMAIATSPAFAAAGPSGAGETKKKGTTRKLLQGTAFGSSLVDQLRSTFTGVRADEAVRRRKIPFIALGAVIVIVLIAGIVWLTPKGEPTEQGSTVGGPTNKQPGPPPAPEGMVLISGGKFLMGYAGSDDPSEKPEHEVSVDSFYLDLYEVTNEQYAKFVSETRHPPPGSWKSSGRYAQGEERLPVTSITWFDAKAYAAWAKRRLPTEQEWEYAARGTDNRLYPWGKGFDPKKANVGSTDGGNLKPVGSYPEGKSPFGAFDMAGNAFEWTDSDPILYPGSKAKPKPGKVVRGGSYLSREVFAMATTRAHKLANESREDIGFRCAMDAPK